VFLYKKNHIVIIIIVCFALFFTHLGILQINIMEARNFITAREMIVDGNWIFTTLNGQPRYQKPPLPTWITAVFAMAFGLKNIVALRIPAAILGTATVLFSYKFSEKIFKKKYFALISSLIMATSFYITFAARDANWDIFTHGFMMGCIYMLYLFFSSEKKRYLYAVGAALFFGCSFMSKGPVSLYALLVPFLIAYSFTYKYKSFKKKAVPLIIFLVTAFILSSWWYWYTYTYDTIAVKEITSKETGNWTKYNIRPFYYYWSFFTQSGLWTLPAFIGLLYPYLKNRVFNKKGYTFTLLWTLISVFLLSIIPEKKSRYLLPVLIPLALNTAFYIEYLFRQFKLLKNKLETIPVYFNFGLIACIGLVFPVVGYFFIKDNINGNWVWFILLAVVLFILGFFMVKNLIKKKIQPVFYLSIGFVMSVLCLGMPLASSLNANPHYKSIAQLNKWKKKTQLEVYEFTGVTPEMIWAYGEPIKRLTYRGVFSLPKEKIFGVLVSKHNTKKFTATFKEYSVKKVTTYDMNSKRSHRARLWRNLYIVSPKKNP